MKSFQLPQKHRRYESRHVGGRACASVGGRVGGLVSGWVGAWVSGWVSVGCVGEGEEGRGWGGREREGWRDKWERGNDGDGREFRGRGVGGGEGAIRWGRSEGVEGEGWDGGGGGEGGWVGGWVGGGGVNNN